MYYTSKMRLPLALIALVSSCCAVDALALKGRIQWNELCPDIDHLGQAKVVLDQGKLYAGITRDGEFEIPDVPAGTYILSVLAHDHTFDKARIDVFESDTLPEVRPYIPATPLSPPLPVKLPYPIKLTARQKYDYFVPRQSFNMVGMFQNPMMMMTVGVGIMMLLMPYLMKNMDPEVMEEFKERHARMTNVQSSLQNGDLSGLTSLLTNDSSTSATAQSSGKQVTTTNAKARSGKGKRR